MTELRKFMPLIHGSVKENNLVFNEVIILAKTQKEANRIKKFNKIYGKCLMELEYKEHFNLIEYNEN